VEQVGFRAVIFDLWGTLIPFAVERWQRMFASMADALGVPLEEFEREWRQDYHRRLVSDLRVSVENVARVLGVTRADAIERCLELRIAGHRETFAPRADAAATLRELRAHGFLTGLITNCSSEIPELLNESSLAGLFDVEVFSCRAGLRKPDRAIYELAAAELGLDPRRCLYIGDGDDQELDGARDAGMRAVLLRSPDTRPPENWQGAEIDRLADALTLVA
jgi:putative hydrolase of the HAD superfamily